MAAAERRERAMTSLEGLALGDAFGESWFIHPEMLDPLLSQRALPRAPWTWTDDTLMASSIVGVLVYIGEIEQDALASSFAGRYARDRGYGPAMHSLLSAYREGVPWHVGARGLFGGSGSFGNGSAMRVGPLGAFYADDIDTVIAEAEKSAVVTHCHPEAVAGAIAVAVAAALVTPMDRTIPTGDALLRAVRDVVPDSEVREGIDRAIRIGASAALAMAVRVLGNGTNITCQDTVPFALWCAAHHLDDFEEAMWVTVSGLGDRDTTCAIVGGLVASHLGRPGLPAAWLAMREPLPGWIRAEPSA